ncbi:MAG: IS30 family transposase [Malacoplasma sp.]
MTNYNHLLKEQRTTIEHLLSLNHNFTYIANSINVDRTTISKEIKRNRYIKSNFYDAFNIKGINSTVEKCERLKKPPYVCNSCKNKKFCTNHKLYYNSNLAQNNYNENLVNSRIGADINASTIDEIENSIAPLIKDNKQSVNQIYINHADVLYFCKTTFYKYINDGIFSLCNLDLPKKVKYKKRKHTNNHDYKRKLAILKGRTYEEYIEFMINHPKMNICEMDTVEGKKSGKVFLTLLIRDTKFMFIRLLDKKNIASVNNEIDKLKSILGIKLFAKVFRIVLTDNGNEFLDPLKIEIDYDTGNKVCNVFYCHPYSSFEKAGLEHNHEYIRRVFPKGVSLNNLTIEQVQNLENNINHTPREKYNGKTPYEMTKEKYPLLLEKLNYKFIKPDDVSLNIKDIMGVQ